MQKINRDLMDLTGYVNIWREQTFNASLGQTDFVLGNGMKYPVNRNMIQVHLNGDLQRKNVDYSEFNETTIKFLEGLREGDVVHLRFQVPYSEVLTSWPDIKIEEAKKVANVMKSQNFTATAGQTSFSLSTPYAPGTHSINVYVNGGKQRTGVDFTEPDDGRVVFKEGLRAGDRVEITWLAPSGQFLLGTVNIADAPDESVPQSKIKGLPGKLDEFSAQLEQISVNVKSFGAVGDGITDDTTAFKNAILYCVKNEYTLFIPEGTFVVGKIGTVDISGKQLKILGSGKGSVLKRKAGSAINKFDMLIEIRAITADAKFVSLTNFTVDSNATENTIPEGKTEYALDRCSAFEIWGSKSNNAFIDYVEVSKMWFYDPVAAHVFFSGVDNCGVRNIRVTDVYCDKRDRVMGDIVVVGGCRTLTVDNFVGSQFLVELNSPYVSESGEKPIMITSVNNSIIGFLNLIGRNMYVNVNNVDMDNIFIGTATSGKVSNSVIRNSNKVALLGGSSKILTFDNCEFHYEVEPTTLKSSYLQVGNTEFTINFNSCNFILDHDESVNIDAIAMHLWVAGSKGRRVTVTNCVFDKRFKQSIYADRCGDIYLKNNNYGGWEYALRLAGSTTYGGISAIVDGGDFYSTTCPINIEVASSTNLILKNIQMGYSIGKVMNNFVSNYALMTVNENSRIMFSDVAPNGGGFVGDTVRLKLPIAGQPCEWIATRTHTTDAQWKVSKTLGA